MSNTYTLLNSPRLCLIGLAVLCLSVSSCSLFETNDWRFNGPDDAPSSVNGMRPVYAVADANEIYSDVVRRVENGIAVFEEGDRLYTVDADRGVHVVDNSDPLSPRQLVFIRILGVRTASVSDNFLYANNFTDFVTIDVSNLDNVVVVDRQANFYETPPASPPNFQGFFECYDEDQGPLLGWEQAVIINPRCRSSF